MNVKPLRDGWQRWLDDARLHLAHPDALLHLAVVGLLTGLLAGGVIVLFRLAVEGTQALMLPGGGPENYEGLDWWWRLVLPLAGGVLIGLLFRWNKGEDNVLGVTKVLERMAYHQGHMSWRSLFLQFAGAAVAIISGHSVGREGPHVYLGAASGSLLGQHLTLPHNAIRTLVACGSAAGIAASFNTPLAGVIFSVEVIMPGMLAIVVAGLVSKRVFKKDSLFITMLRANGMDYDTNPVLQAMRRVGVASKMRRNFARSKGSLDRTKALSLLKDEPDWLVIDGDEGKKYLMPAVDLARYLEESGSSGADNIKLSQIPAQRYQLAAIHLQATLQEAMDKLEQSGAEAIYVEQPTSPGSRRIRGILTRSHIESAYRL